MILFNYCAKKGEALRLDAAMCVSVAYDVFKSVKNLDQTVNYNLLNRHLAKELVDLLVQKWVVPPYAYIVTLFNLFYFLFLTFKIFFFFKFKLCPLYVWFLYFQTNKSDKNYALKEKLVK